MSETMVCVRPDCEVKYFVPKVHNQIFCSDECCKIETNRRIMRKYYETKERLSGKKRICKSCNVTELSRYNPSRVCAPCESKQARDGRESLLSLINDIVV